MSRSLCNFNVNHFSIEACILELIKISLDKKASSIAVRFSPKKCKIQVVDNGIGFTKHELSVIFNKDEFNDSITSIFNKIISSSNTVIITSRKKFSSNTYVTVASVNSTPMLFEGYHRPSKGTTVTVYNFNSDEWNNGDEKNYSISYIIAAIALMELNVSFSLRNDDQQRMLLNIIKSHNPWEVLKNFKNNNISQGLMSPSLSVNLKIQINPFSDEFKKEFEASLSQLTSWSYLLDNDDDDDDFSTINNDFSSQISKWSDWSCNFKMKDKNQDITTMNNDLTSQISDWSNWSFNSKIAVKHEINEDYGFKFIPSTQQIDKFDDNFINLTQLSVWSDWSYNPGNLNFKTDPADPRYKYLPMAICRLSNVSNHSKAHDIIDETSACAKSKAEECRISGNTINSLEILRQVNKEFIIAIANENGKKFLLAIDQHAVHERIRYEWLLENYRGEKNYKYISEKLHGALIISDINNKSLKLLISHRNVLSRVGINIKSIIDSTTCLVDRVPKCFLKGIKNFKNQHYLYKLIKNIRLLLMEVSDGLSKNVLPPILPITINNAIASEACHEAIKFGDPLSVRDCTVLIQALQDTKAPTRCAHGRPSIVPIMNLAELEKKKILESKN